MKFKLPAGTDIWEPSRPARGAWVEMLVVIDLQNQYNVAPRKGRVG